MSITAYAAPDEAVEVANKKAENYHKLLLKRPGNPTVFNRFVNSWLDTGDKKGLRSWLEKRAESGSVADLRVLSAFHEYLGEDALALQLLSKAVEKAPKNAELRLVRAKMLARSLAFDQALKDLTLASKDEKVGIEASKLRGIYLARSGQIEKAVAAWKVVITRFPKDEELREDLIELQVIEGLYDDAATASRELIVMTKDPYLKVLRKMRLGDVEILADKRKEGLKTYQDILDATGEGTWIEREILARLEKVYLREDNVKGLRDLYQKIREKYPRRMSIQKVLARQMAATGEMDEAIALFRDVLKITPGNLANRQEFMNFLEKNGKWKEAKEELDEVLKVRKNDALLWQRLAQIEQLLENKPGVKKAIDHVRDLKKSTPEGIITTSSLYDSAELKADAEALLREGLKLFADSGEVKEALASFLIQNKKEKEAIAIWREMAKGASREVLLRVARSLMGHGKTSEGFSLLQERTPEFKNDALILAQLCVLATTKDEAVVALPHALALVKLAATPTDMETYMRLAVQVINNGEKNHEIKNQLVAKEKLTISECCLLAELFTNEGDTIGADKYLEQAEKTEQGLLAKFYRVHYNERRGELGKAVAIMESIVTSPEGGKTVYMRRLVGLLQSDGKLDEALARVDEWKRMAPGDRAAWQKRADVLSLLGRPDESVTELRRMIGKFGSEESLQASLATGLIEIGDYKMAQKIYEQLYDEADTLNGKLKWVRELAELGKQEGSHVELLESFDRRGRLNPQSIEPLLAKAEIYNVLNQYGERREILIEATRRRPDDAQLLMNLSDVEERAGELDRAITTLRQAVKFDKTYESKNKLAKLLINSGEIDVGLRVLAEIPSQSADARKVEKTVESLLKSREWEAAIDYLKQMPQHAGDWRLQYLKGICLHQMGKEQEAFDLLAGMANVSGEIKGVKPLVAAKNLALMHQSNYYPAFKGWNRLSRYFNYAHRANASLLRRNNYSRGYGAASLISLPGTAKEAAWMSTLQAAIVANDFPEEKRKKAWAKLSANGVEELSLFLMVNMNRYQGGSKSDLHEEINKRLEKDPNNPVLLTYWLGGLKPETIPSKERLHEILAVFEKHNSLSAAMAVQQMFQFKALSNEEVVSYLLDLYNRCEGEKKDALGSQMFSRLSSRSPLEGDLKKRVEQLCDETLKRLCAQEDEPKNSGWTSGLLNELLIQGKSKEAVQLINRLCQWEAKRKPMQSGMGVSSYTYSPQNYYMRMHSGMQYGRGSIYLLPPPKYPHQVKGIHGTLLGLITRSMQQTASPVKMDAEHKKLLKLLGGKSKSVKVSQAAVRAANNPAELFEPLRGQTDGIENTILRAMILMVLKDDTALEALVKQFELSASPNELLIAAGFYHDIKEGEEKAYRILEKVAVMGSLSVSERKKVDGYLVYQGASLASKKDNQLDLEAAKRASLRLRKRVSAQRKSKLITMMQTLGLAEEVTRMKKSTKLLARVKKSKTHRRPTKGSALCLVLIREEKMDDAIREAAKEVRRLTRTAQSNSNHELKQHIEFLKKHQLIEATMKKLDPGENGSFARRLSYADFCRTLQRNEKAFGLYTQLLEERPSSQEAQVGWMMTSPEKGLGKRMLEKDEDGKVDFEKLDLLFDQMNTTADNDVDMTLRMFSSLGVFLEQLEPSISEDVNLTWVNYFTASRSMDTYFREHRLAKLINGKGGSISSGENAEKTEERDRLAKKLFINMLRHPQTAEQGFILLMVSKKRLELTDDDLLKFAKKSAIEVIRRPSLNPIYAHVNTLWHRRSRNGTSSSSTPRGGIGPIAYLTSEGLKEGASFLDKKSLASIKKHQPEKFKRITLVMKLSEAEGKVASSLFKEWSKSLPTETRLKNQEIYKFINTVVMINPKNAAWTGELQKLLLSERLAGYAALAWSQAHAKWARWLMSVKGSAACEEYLNELLVKQLVPKDKWPILVKLGNNRLPSDYRQRIYGLDALFNLMFADSVVAGTAARIIIDNDLSKVFSNVKYRMQRLWNVSHTSPEDFVEWLQKNKLVKKRAKGSPFIASRAFFISEIARQIRFKDNKMKEAAAKLLLADKNSDPILAQIIAAYLLGPDKGREVITNSIAKNPKDFATLIASSKPRTQTMLKYWFPDLTTGKENRLAAKYLQKLRGSLLAEAKSKAAVWMKDGITLTRNGSRGSECMPHVALIIEDDPYEGAKLWAKILGDVRRQSNLQVSNRSFSSSSSLTTHDSWNSNLIQQHISRSRSTISPISQIKFVHHLYSNDANQNLLELGSNTNSSGSYLWRHFEKSFPQLKIPREKSYQSVGLAMEAWAKQLTEPEQATMIVMLSDSLSGRMRINGNDKAKYEKWVVERYAGKSTPVAVAMKSICLQRIRTYGSSKAEDREAQQKEESAAFADLLQLKGLSVAMRTDLVNKTMMQSSSQSLAASEQVWKLIIQLLADYKNSDRAVGRSVWTNAVIKLGELKFEGRKNVAGAMAIAVEDLLINHQTANSRNQTALIRSIFLLGLEAGNKKIIHQYLNTQLDALRGNLSLMLELMKQGEPELAKRLVAAGGVSYSTKGLGLYDDAFGKQSKQLVSILPEKSRYRVEALLVNCQDSSKAKPAISREKRIKDLAERYKEEKPRVRLARLEVLSIIAADTEASKLVEQELRDELGTQTLGKIILTQNDPQGKIEGEQLKIIIARINKVDVDAGRMEGLQTHIKSLRVLGGSNEAYQASSSARELIKTMKPQMLVKLAEKPEVAKKWLSLAADIIKCSTALARNSSSIFNEGPPLSVMIYCLAGQSKELEALIQSLPEPERLAYEKNLKSYNFAQKARYLVDSEWKADKNKGNRQRLFTALLQDEWFCKHAISKMNDLSKIVSSGFATSEDVDVALNAMPDIHSRKVGLLCEKANMMARDGNEVEKADLVFAKAYDLAESQKNERAMHLVLAYRSTMLANKGKLDRAKKWGIKVKHDMLDKSYLDPFLKATKKWQKPAKKK